MIINWYGEGCFKVQTSGVTLLVDSFESTTGLTPPRFKADIELSTSTAYPLPEGKSTEAERIVGPGEYEVKDIDIVGWPISGTEKISAVYRVRAEGLSLGFLGHVASLPNAEILEHMGHIDILFIPANGAPFIGVEKAAQLIKQINPKIVIPSFFKIPGLKRKASSVDTFLKELGQKATPQEKLTIKKKELPAKTEVVVLKL